MKGDEIIHIKIIGSNCSNGIKLSKMVYRAVSELGGKYRIDNIESDKKYGITNYPGLIVDGKVVSQGKVLTVRELKKIFI